MDTITKNINGNFLRKPPSSIEAEQAVLSAIITNNKALDKVIDYLKPEHFIEKMNEQIYDACVKIWEKGHLIDIITLKHYLETNGTLDIAGGIDYLTGLASSVISILNIDDYAKLVYECALKRNLIDIGTDIVNDAFGGSSTEEILTAEKQIDKAEDRLYKLSVFGESLSGPRELSDTLHSSMQIIEEAYKSDDSISGISTGLKDLDKKLGGFRPTDLLIIAGRPGMGKTALALNIAVNVAGQVLDNKGPKKLQGPVLFFSLEMSADQLASRILSTQAEINGNKILNGNIAEDEFNKLVEYQRALSSLPLYIDDTPDLTVPMMRARARRLKSKSKNKCLSLIVVDYVQLLNSASGRKPDNRVQEISEITRGLKMLAKELEVPVVALSQLSRLVEQRADNKPQLSDLRESGSIEQDADCVMFVYREVYYHKNREPIHSDPTSHDYIEWQKKYNKIKNISEVIIGKHRHGATGEVKLLFVDEYVKFSDFYEISSDS